MKVIDILKLLPAGYRERAIKNATGQAWSSQEAEGLAGAIEAGVPWDDTPEGKNFWSKVHIWARGMGMLPPLPSDKATLQLVLTVTYDLNGARIKDLKDNLSAGAEYLAGIGKFTQDTEAEVIVWTAKVEQDMGWIIH